MKSVIIGAGTYGEVYLAYLQEAGVEIIGFIDDDPTLQGAIINGVPVLGDINALKSIACRLKIEAVYCPIGKNKIRAEILNNARKIGLMTPNFIHKDVEIAPHVEINANSSIYILPKTLIMPWTKIEKNVMISANTMIAHHNILKEGVFVSSGVNFGASIVAEKYAYIGIGSTIMTGLHRLGEDCLVGAGAVVIKDVPDYAVMAGVPTKVLKIK